jgi:hypothetical protein
MTNSSSDSRFSPEVRRILLEMDRRGISPPYLPPPATIWSPHDGPQRAAFESEADVTGYGGQAGGGKTDLLLGLAATAHHDSIIFRREYTQFRALIKRSREILAPTGARFNTNTKTWKDLPGDRTIELGAVAFEDSVQSFQGNPHDFIGFDELTGFIESQFWFLTGWLRSVRPGQRCRIVCTFNPPTSSDGRWVTRFFGPWLDKAHPRRAMPGELRWFARLGEDDREVEGPEPFEHEGITIRPQSRTFFPASLRDNPPLARTGYGARLLALPEPLRSQLAFGDFEAGVQDGAWQVIPTAWVEAAFARWRAYECPPGPCTSAGVDVAHGGRDRTVVAPRHGDHYIGTLLAFPGEETPTGSAAAALVAPVLACGAWALVDAIGYGASCHERLAEPPPAGHGLEAHALNSGLPSLYRDKSRKFRMANIRAEMYWRVRDALDPEGGGKLALPPDRELLEELTAVNYVIRGELVYLEEKSLVTSRLGRSPDKADAVAQAMLPRPGSARLRVGGAQTTLTQHIGPRPSIFRAG